MAGFGPHLLEYLPFPFNSLRRQVPPRIRELIAETLKPKPNLQPGMACHFLEDLISDG